MIRWKKRPRRYVVKPWYPRHSFSSVSRSVLCFGGLFSKQSPGFLNMSPSCRNFLLFTSLKSVAVIHAFFNTQPLVFLAVHDTLNICWNPFISKAYIVRAAHLPSWWLSFHNHVATGIIKASFWEPNFRCDMNIVTFSIYSSGMNKHLILYWVFIVSLLCNHHHLCSVVVSERTYLPSQLLHYQ